MKLIILTLLIIFIQSCKESTNQGDLINIPTIEESELEADYPWTKETTKTAIETIYNSIENLKLAEFQKSENFPADPGPYNVPFSQTEKVEFGIISYSYLEAEPEIYEIEFRPINNLKSGNRIAVEINIVTNIPIRVFMKPDA